MKQKQTAADRPVRPRFQRLPVAPAGWGPPGRAGSCGTCARPATTRTGRLAGWTVLSASPGPTRTRGSATRRKRSRRWPVRSGRASSPIVPAGCSARW